MPFSTNTTPSDRVLEANSTRGSVGFAVVVHTNDIVCCGPCPVHRQVQRLVQQIDLRQRYVAALQSVLRTRICTQMCTHSFCDADPGHTDFEQEYDFAEASLGI